ncbi:MAG: hypothetical protein WCL34_15685, partial [Methylococcaceae bacterium]
GKSFTKGAEGKFEGTAASDALTQAKQDLSDKMTQVKSDLNKFKPSLSGGVASLPSFSLGSWNGKDLTFDLSDYESQLSVLSSVFIFLATLFAFRIVFGGD